VIFFPAPYNTTFAHAKRDQCEHIPNSIGIEAAARRLSRIANVLDDIPRAQSNSPPLCAAAPASAAGGSALMERRLVEYTWTAGLVEVAECR